MLKEKSVFSLYILIRVTKQSAKKFCKDFEREIEIFSVHFDQGYKPECQKFVQRFWERNFDQGYRFSLYNILIRATGFLCTFWSEGYRFSLYILIRATDVLCTTFWSGLQVFSVHFDEGYKTRAPKSSAKILRENSRFSLYILIRVIRPERKKVLQRLWKRNRYFLCTFWSGLQNQRAPTVCCYAASVLAPIVTGADRGKGFCAPAGSECWRNTRCVT
jgi:hypothetical protein